jgi:hypothetical protein
MREESVSPSGLLHLSVLPVVLRGSQPRVSNVTEWTDGTPGSGASLRKNLVSQVIVFSCSGDQASPPNGWRVSGE